MLVKKLSTGRKRRSTAAKKVMNALALLQTMCDERVWRDTTSYSAAISACEKGKHWEVALELLKECRTWTTANTISYSAAISACEKGGEW